MKQRLLLQVAEWLVRAAGQRNIYSICPRCAGSKPVQDKHARGYENEIDI